MPSSYAVQCEGIFVPCLPLLMHFVVIIVLRSGCLKLYVYDITLGTVLDTGMRKLMFPLFKLYFVGGWIRTRVLCCMGLFTGCMQVSVLLSVGADLM
jgi:hypothetical protein